MERDANYLAVGAFTLLVAAMAVTFVFWYRGLSDSREYDRYEIYFSGSVSGLSLGGPVRYLGVDVGRVQRIALKKDRPDTVTVIVDVDRNAPISGATRASLGLQGVTGLLYINLQQAEGASQESLRKGEHYPVIESQSSNIDALLASLPELVTRANNLLDRASGLFSEQNMAAVSKTLDNLRATTDRLPDSTRHVDELLAQLSATAAEIKTTAANVNGMVSDTRPEVVKILARMNQASEDFTRATQRLDALVASTSSQVGHFTDQGLFEMERLLRDARSAAVEFRELSRSLKETPSQLMFERPETGLEIKP
jgi:phospholipid/cholesterol/gamma-HCH transport system substrate-binding protein